MKRILATLLSAGCAMLASTIPAEQPATEPAAGEETETKPAQFKFPPVHEPSVVTAEEALTIRNTHGSDLLVVNYWATWCGPCVEELPYFIDLAKEYPESRLRVVGISLDLGHQN